MKKFLGIKNGDPDRDESTNQSLEKKLKSWLNNSPIYLVLQWFDTVDCVKISSKARLKKDGRRRSRCWTGCFLRKWESGWLFDLSIGYQLLCYQINSIIKYIPFI
jgi:hypothetical protein